MYSSYFIFEILKNKSETPVKTGAIKNVIKYPNASPNIIILIPAQNDITAPIRKGNENK